MSVVLYHIREGSLTIGMGKVGKHSESTPEDSESFRVVELLGVGVTGSRSDTAFETKACKCTCKVKDKKHNEMK